MNEIIELRRKIILKGKATKRFGALGKKKGRTDAKYCDPENIDDSGAISELDTVWLHAFVETLQPKIIVEVGTWFGTSAAIMAHAAPMTKIYTCDHHDVYVPYEPYNCMVKTYNTESNKFFDILIKKGIKTDFVFLDARLKRDDPKKIRKLFKGKIRLATHDYGQGKGDYNIKLLKKIAKFRVSPIQDTHIALMEEK